VKAPIRLLIAALLSFSALAQNSRTDRKPSIARRVVILKVDGLNADLLYDTMRQINPATGKSELPWLTHIFSEGGLIFENFYTRGISLSAPSWSMLDTGRHAIIRGNVEYDRYTGYVYDYLNFFPFYIGYARQREVDMPAVEVLDRAGIPLMIDSFGHAETYQSFQLFQRGVRWKTLENVLKARFSSASLLSLIEGGGATPLDDLWAFETERELNAKLQDPAVLYLDFYTGEIDHEGHATSQSAALQNALKRLDGLAGRLWTAIQASALAQQTVFTVVSDHGMNNVPGIFSQAFSLPDLLNSPQGGAHHVITNRHPLSDYKLKGLNPLVQRVVTPSTASFYLDGESSRYPTAWLDLDGNERASVHLRNSDLNKIHILLLQLARPELPGDIRRAAAAYLMQTIDRHRPEWGTTSAELQEELRALKDRIEARRQLIAKQPKRWSSAQKAKGEDRQARRLTEQLSEWTQEYGEYSDYLRHLLALLALDIDPKRPLQVKISELIPEMSLGDNNGVADLQHYVVGPAPGGLALDPEGRVDEERSFRYVDYFSLLAAQRVRNNPQAALSARPIDFTALRLSGTKNVYWLYRDEDSQLLILQDSDGSIALKPVRHLTQDRGGKITWIEQSWRAGLPLCLFEDKELRIPGSEDRAAWLSSRHSEREWFNAIHKCRYSNGVISVTEQFSPIALNIPGIPGLSPVLLRYERRRRELVQPDFQAFAADHWNFNVRNFNPGGNHGSFLRISTHSVWMMAGAGVPVEKISEPYDSLNFASSVLDMVGKTPPMPGRVVALH
jgi:hypothetical protein